STITFAEMNPSRLEKLTSLPSALMSRWYSLTTGIDASHGNGTTWEICTPRPSASSSFASALLPTNETFQKEGAMPAFFISLMNAAHDLYALTMTIACGCVFFISATALSTSTVLRSTVAVATIG